MMAGNNRPNLSISTNNLDDGVSNNDNLASQLLSPTMSALNAVTSKFIRTPNAAPPVLKKNQNWSHVVHKTPYEDYDSLEGGDAREVISEECLSPVGSDKKWTNCYIERVDKTKYRMFADADDRFLLSAKQIGDVFYISQYSHFPEQTADHPSSGYCAVLRRVEDSAQFKLFSTGCEHCDGRYYTCGHTADDGTYVLCDRQLLAEISQSTKRIAYVDADMRCLTVQIPAVLPDKRTRVVWCPRSMRMDSPATSSLPRRASFALSSPTSTPRGTANSKFFDSKYPKSSSHTDNNYGEESIRGAESTEGEEADLMSPPKGEETRDVAELDHDKVELRSKLPEWNPELKSLVLKFNGGRVLAASSKNFMLTTSADTLKGIMQFGKARRGKFVLDYRHPIAPIQAFGIALAACHWCINN